MPTRTLDSKIEDLIYSADQAMDPYSRRRAWDDYQDEAHPEVMASVLRKIQYRDRQTVELAQLIISLDGKFATKHAQEILEQYNLE